MNSNFGMVQVDGRSYCAGLFWYPLEGGPNNAEQLENILSEQHAAFYATRGHPPAQVGLVDGETGAQRGNLSIAACVADRLTREGLRSFLVALPTDVPELWCYVAQNQELIQFDGDLLGTAEDVQGRMAEHLAAAVDWELVIAPADWNVLGAVQRERAELLPQGRALSGLSDARLRPVQRRSASGGAPDAVGLALMATVLLLLAEGGAGYWVWRSQSNRLEAQRAAASIEQQAFVAQRPWLDKPDLAQWGPTCLGAMARQAMDLAGWSVSRIVCDPAAARLRVEWLRTDGALFEDLLALRPTARLAPGAAEPATASAAFPLAPPRAGRLPYAPAQLPHRPDWQRAASRWAEQWREQRPTFTATASGDDGGAIPWSLAGDFPPAGQLQALTLPGSVLGGIEFNQRDGKAVWTVKATHYVQD